MKLREAQTLKPGQSLEALVGSPCGGGSRWDPARKTFIGVPLPSGEAVEFVRIIPKVRITQNGPWDDRFDQMLLCRRTNGGPAWINIRNAYRIPERQAA